jgi:hypothetical protein
MGYRASYTGTERITLTNPEYWVEIATCLSRGALAKAEAALSQTTVRPNADGDGESTVMTPQVSEYRDLMVLGSLMAWNLDDDAGRVMEISRENMALLSGEDFDLIHKRVDELNSPMSGDEQKRFPAQG